MIERKTNIRFFCSEYPGSGNSSTLEHLTIDGKTALCGTNVKGEPRDAANWETIHSSRFHRRCPKCQQAAVMLIRPKAAFWYLDPFVGQRKEFRSLQKARKEAKKEHGNCTIWQTGPGETNKIVDVIHGQEPLP